MTSKSHDPIPELNRVLQRLTEVVLLFPLSNAARQALWQHSKKAAFLLTKSVAVASTKGLKPADVDVLTKLGTRADAAVEQMESVLFIGSAEGGRRFSERELLEALRGLGRSSLYRLADANLPLLRRTLRPELLGLPLPAARGVGDVVDDLKQLLEEVKVVLIIAAAVLLLIAPELAAELLALALELEAMDQVFEGETIMGVVPVPGGAACNYIGTFVELSARGNHEIAGNIGILELFDDQQSLLLRSTFQVPPTGGGNAWVPVALPERQIIQSTVADGCGKEGIFGVFGKLTVELDQAGLTRRGSTSTAFLGNNKLCSPQGFEDRQQVRARIDVTQGGTAGVIEFKVALKLTGKCAS